MEIKRRKAIDAELISESKTSPGYFKYIFTIQEKDGSTQKMPAYGKDMKDALSRLLLTEQINKKRINNTLLVSTLIVIIIPSLIAGIINSPWWIIGSLILSISFGIVLVRVDKYFNK